MNKQELQMLQALPLDLKIAKSKLRIEEFVRWFGSDKVYISFSGGKDSTVLLHLVRSLYPDIPAVFSNTGLEFPELVKFAKSKENVIEVRPEKTFRQVLQEHGYPVISKKTSRMLHDVMNPTEKNKRSRKLYLSDYTLDKEGNYTDKKNGSFKIAQKHRYLINAPFKISNKCCDELKKKPIKKWQKENKDMHPIIGIMANESKMREATYLKSGCNSFDEKTGSCTPLGFWTEQDILQYIVKYKLEYATVYGEIKQDNEGKYYTTGEKRTGCIFCMYGIHLEKGENRFQRLYKTHNQLWQYCMDQLGFREVCEYMNIPIKPIDNNYVMKGQLELKL